MGQLSRKKDSTYPKTGMADLVNTASSSQNILTAEMFSAETLQSLFSSIRGTDV